MSLEQRIAELEAAIKGYEAKFLNAATTEKESQFAGLITTARQNLQQLLKQRQQSSRQRDAVNLQELDFEGTLEKEDFPPSNGGAVLFKRSNLVKRMVDTFTVRVEGSTKYSNFYFCHSAGTGKTVLLKLFGKELQQRGFVVFMLTAPQMDCRPEDYFKNLADNMAKDGKQVAVLVDEVQRNVNSLHWDYLLKKASPNLLVIGTGISDLTHESPQFLDKYPSTITDNPTIGHLTEEDMPEVLDYFIRQGRADVQWDLKANALRELLVATGGQLYPFVVIAKHLLEPKRVEHLSNVSAYLTSKAFYNCDDYVQVRKRCYDLSLNKVDFLSRFLLEQRHKLNDIENAMKSGLLTGTSFVSPLLVQEVFHQLLKTFPSNEIKLDLSGKSSPIQQIIVAGLANMRPLDFKESNFSTLVNNERGLAFRWGVCAGSALKDQVWLTSEVVTEERKGKKPTIGFVVNGDLNLGLELARDRTDVEILDKLKNLGTGGVYSRHDSYLLHFVFKGTMEDAVQQVNVYPEHMRTRVYTYLRDNNALLCGTEVVQKGVVPPTGARQKRVVRKLATPPSMPPTGVRQFGTLTLGALRRLGRYV